MRWEGREESENVEDRRGMRGGPIMITSFGGLIIVLIALWLGVDPQRLLNPGPGGQIGQPGGGPQPGAPVDPEQEKLAQFSKVIFRDTEIVWTDLFRQLGKQYQKPTLVLFSGQVQSACGMANAAVGPFYCGGDGNVYIDLDFYQDMQRKLNAPGDFARAYVLAHEVGHHVQRLLGYANLAERSARGQSKQMSVRLELQADFLAGVWAHHAQEKFNFLEKGDMETALNAAFQIGDDRLQKQAQGYVVPDAFTHGTSKQRMRWFADGFQTGDVRRANLLFELPYDEL